MRIMLCIVLIAAPTMLFVKPIYLNRKYKKEAHHHHHHHKSVSEEEGTYNAINDDVSPPKHSSNENKLQNSLDFLASYGKDERKAHHSFGDLFIH